MRWSLKVPKAKTCKTLSKRVVIRNSGSVKTGRVGMQHNALVAPAQRKRKASTQAVNETKLRAIRHLLPYGGFK
jgi:ribosomal protein L35